MKHANGTGRSGRNASANSIAAAKVTTDVALAVIASLPSKPIAGKGDGKQKGT